MKKILTIVFIIITMIGVSGCMNNSQDKMITYMNNKYDDEFVYYEPFGGGIGSTSKQIIVKSKKYPEAKIWVAYYDDYTFADNYVDFKYEQKTKEFLQTYLKNIFGCDVKVIYSVSAKGNRNSFDGNTSFDDYIESDESNIGIKVVVDIDFKKENQIISIFEEKVSNDNIIRFADIYFAETTEQFNNFDGTLSNVKRIVFSKNVEDESCICEWR